MILQSENVILSRDVTSEAHTELRSAAAASRDFLGWSLQYSKRLEEGASSEEADPYWGEEIAHTNLQASCRATLLHGLAIVRCVAVANVRHEPALDLFAYLHGRNDFLVETTNRMTISRTRAADNRD